MGMLQFTEIDQAPRIADVGCFRAGSLSRPVPPASEMAQGDGWSG